MNAHGARAALAALLLASLPARARATEAANAAAAEALYQEGRQLLLSAATETACARLQASQSIQPGIGTLLLLGHCYEALGKTASAWATFRAAESFARAAQQNERAEIGRVRAAALELRLSRLRVQLPAGIDTSQWSVRQDNHLLPISSLETPLPVDPGEHQLSVSALGFEPWSVQLVILPERALTELVVPPLTPSPSSALAGSPALAAPAPDTRDGAPWRRHWGLAGATLGGAGLVVGLGYALHAQHQYGQSLDRCRTETLCSASGLALRERAETSARVATLASLSGAALALGGLALWWTAPSAEPALASAPATELGVTALGPHAALGVTARGAF